MRTRTAIALLAAAPVYGAMLPEALGEFTGKPGPLAIRTSDKELLAEYRLAGAERCVYASASGRSMIAEAYRFADSRAGRAAFLWLQPRGAVPSPVMQTWSPEVGRLAAVTGSGRTVMGWRNFVLVFRGASPDHAAVDGLLRTMPDPDSVFEEEFDGTGWMDRSSERFLLGPESLARFAPEIPPSVAAFRFGGWGRTARFEMPSGAVTRILFEYPDAVIAAGRVPAFESLRGVRLRPEGKRVAFVLGAVDPLDEDRVLATAFPHIVTFDPDSMWCQCGLTLQEGMVSTLVAGLIGAVFGATLRLADDGGIRDRTTRLNLGLPTLN